MIKPYKGAKFHKDITDNRVIFQHREHIKKALQEHGPEVTRELKRLVSTGIRTGRVYSYRGRKYRASAPGEPPAKRSGRLADSFESIARTMELIIGNSAFSDNNAPYPSFLELGTSKMAPRPFFLLIIDKLHARLQMALGGFKG